MGEPATRAFAVTEIDENTGAVIFAKHDIVARRVGANEYADGEIGYVSCHRAPWADRFAVTRRVPARVMIAHGWHFECAGCGQRIDEDWLDDNRLTVAGVIGAQDGPVYCCSRCARKDMSRRRRRKAEERRAIEAFKAVVRARFPDADFCDDEQSSWRGHHAYVVNNRGGWHWQQVIVTFRFPGAKYGPAAYRMDGGYKPGPHQPRYECAAGDREAFEQYAKSTERTR